MRWIARWQCLFSRRGISSLLGLLVVFLAACSGKEEPSAEQENVITMRSDTLRIEQTENGNAKSTFYAPVMEEYAFAPEPYREFSRGIELETFDSLGRKEFSIRSNYALEWIALQRWDLKGDVVGTNTDGDKLETQQLTWNQRSELVWSNVQTRLTRSGDVIVGAGFESTQDLRRWRFRQGQGTQSFIAEPNRDTMRVDSVKP